MAARDQTEQNSLFLLLSWALSAFFQQQESLDSPYICLVWWDIVPPCGNICLSRLNVLRRLWKAESDDRMQIIMWQCIFVYVCYRYEQQQTKLKEELAKVAQRESEDMTKAMTRERLHTRQQAEKAKQLVPVHTHKHIFFFPKPYSYPFNIYLVTLRYLKGAPFKLTCNATHSQFFIF